MQAFNFINVDDVFRTILIGQIGQIDISTRYFENIGNVVLVSTHNVVYCVIKCMIKDIWNSNR
jgi:hypothetical protein